MSSGLFYSYCFICSKGRSIEALSVVKKSGRVTGIQIPDFLLEIAANSEFGQNVSSIAQFGVRDAHEKLGLMGFFAPRKIP
jgi:hypothetical protein